MRTPTTPASQIIMGIADKLMDYLPSTMEAGARQMWPSDLIAHFNSWTSYDPNNAAETESLVAAIYLTTRMGLKPGNPHQYISFQTRNAYDKKYKVWFRSTVPIIGYRGYIKMAMQSNYLATVHCEIVMPEDDFEMWTDETGPHFRHVIPRVRESEQDDQDLDANIIDRFQLAYCQWTTTSGHNGFVYSSRKEIEKVAQWRKDPKKPNVWDNHPRPMICKTPLRQKAAKEWDTSTQLEMGVRLDEHIEDRDVSDIRNLIEDTPDELMTGVSSKRQLPKPSRNGSGSNPYAKLSLEHIQVPE